MILTILNYNDGTVYQIHELPTSVLNCIESLEAFIIEKGFKLNDIEFMTHENEQIEYIDTP